MHSSVGGEQLFFICITCFSWALFIYLFVIFLFVTILIFVVVVVLLFYLINFISIVKLFLCLPTSFLTFTLPFLSPIPLGQRVREQLCGAQLPAGVKL